MVTSRILSAVALFATALSAHAGCGLNTVIGRTGDTLQLWVIQGDTPTRYTWRIGDVEAHTRTIPERSLPGRPGSGSRVWAAIRDAGERPSGVEMFEVQSDGTYRPGGHIDLGAVPLAFTWAEERSGEPWLFFDTTHGISVRTRDGDRWIAAGNVEGELTTPRAIGDEIRMNRWAFARNASPRPLRVPAAGEFTWFRTAGQSIAVSTSMRMWSSTDDGNNWRELPAPAPPPARPSLAWSDGDAPALTWSTGSTLHVARWNGQAWQELATIDKQAHDAAGPVVVIGERVIAFATCHRTASTEATVVTPEDTKAIHVAMRPPS